VRSFDVMHCVLHTLSAVSFYDAFCIVHIESPVMHVVFYNLLLAVDVMRFVFQIIVYYVAMMQFAFLNFCDVYLLDAVFIVHF